MGSRIMRLARNSATLKKNAIQSALRKLSKDVQNIKNVQRAKSNEIEYNYQASMNAIRSQYAQSSNNADPAAYQQMQLAMQQVEMQRENQRVLEMQPLEEFEKSIELAKNDLQDDLAKAEEEYKQYSTQAKADIQEECKFEVS